MAFKDKKVLVRVDFNVPLSNGRVTDDTRIVRALPTINHILNQGGSVILMSHLGRPLSKLNEDGSINKQAFSLENIKDHLSALLGREVLFATDCGGTDSQSKAHNLKSNEVLLLENTRFYDGEKKGDHDFAKSLSNLADFYVNDAFGAAHRAHASTTTVAQFFDQDHKTFGFLMEKELEEGNKVLKSSQPPFVAIVGGAKVSDKIALLENMISKASDICIGGGMTYTFLKALGYNVGSSLLEEDKLEMAREILSQAKAQNCKIHLPMDSVIADRFSSDAQSRITEDANIPDGWMGLDIGPQTIELFTSIIELGKTIIWNGPMGVFEFDFCNKGTFAVAKSVAKATAHGAFSLIGGGDSVAAINQSGLSKEVSFISTGGGAMLELLEGKILPGVQAILD